MPRAATDKITFFLFSYYEEGQDYKAKGLSSRDIHEIGFSTFTRSQKPGLYSPTIPTMPTSAIKQFSLDAEPPDRVGCHNRVGTTIPKKVFRITFYVGTAFHMLLFHYLGCDKVVTFKIYVPLSALTLTLAVALAAKI